MVSRQDTRTLSCRDVYKRRGGIPADDGGVADHGCTNRVTVLLKGPYTVKGAPNVF